MSTQNLRTGSVRPDDSQDPRARLVREKYFSLRPRPLERWLWAQGVPASAERVFWLHWHEGMKTGTWCSEVPIRRVAAECCLDTSTVTRAYQLLDRIGCLRRTDPGRDPANPFQQATAVTEVRIPRDLLVELDRHPNRARRHPETLHTAAAPEPTAAAAAPASRDAALPADPFTGLSGRERLAALSQLTRSLSAAERQAYDEATRMRRGHMAFDADSRLSPEERGRVLQHLAMLSAQPRAATAARAVASEAKTAPARKLSLFELARLRRDLQAATSAGAAVELTRQVAWSIEEGALKRFSANHAIHIALKKVREGTWTRPNRMPPNWVHPVSAGAAPETCRRA
jgi:hypothetical protein